MEWIEYNQQKIEYEIQRAKIKRGYLKIKEGKIIVRVPYLVSKKEIQEIVTKKAEWILKALEKTKQKEDKQDKYTQAEFLDLVTKLVQDIKRQTGLLPNQVRIKELKYAWGSCSKNKNIALNAELIKYSERAIRYVILHEFCHMRYMNHSKEFWSMVEQYMPNYKEVKKEFK